MNKKSHISSRTVWILASTIILLATASVVLALTLRNNASTTIKTDTANAEPAKVFSFSGLDGWRQGPSNATSMALFNSEDPNQPSPCFTSVEYIDGSIDIDSKIKQHQASFDDDGYEVKSLGSQTLAMQVNDSDKQYSLHMSQVETAPGQEKLMGGTGLGYLQLDEAYVKIQANCNAADELPATLPALEAIKIDKS